MFPRIFLADPDEHFSNILKLWFAEHNLDLDFRNDLETALEAFQSEKYDLLIAASKFEEVDNTPMIRIVRERYPLLPIFVISESFEKIDFHKAFEAGADDYLMKGINPERIIRIVKLYTQSRGITFKVQ